MAERIKGRAAICPCCERKLIVRALQVWAHKVMDASLRIVATDRDGAIVEQVGREDVERRWAISYLDLVQQYVLTGERRNRPQEETR